MDIREDLFRLLMEFEERQAESKSPTVLRIGPPGVQEIYEDHGESFSGFFPKLASIESVRHFLSSARIFNIPVVLTDEDIKYEFR